MKLGTTNGSTTSNPSVRAIGTSVRMVSHAKPVPSTVAMAVFLQAFPFVVLGVAISAALTTLVPAGRLARLLPRSVWASVPVAAAAGEKAVAIRARDGKKLTLAVKRLAKRRGALLKRKKLAAKRARKNPWGDTRRALKSTIRELTTTSAALVKARAAKLANATEFAALRMASRRATGYSRAIALVDRRLA